MKKIAMKPRFKKNETGYHKHAVKQLAEWVNGITEKEFYIDSCIAFVPDVVCYENGVITNMYEVVYSHPIDGKKLGMIQAWSYFNSSEFSLFEVSADWILKQTKKPERIETMEYYDLYL
jgi:hypothetical protein